MLCTSTLSHPEDPRSSQIPSEVMTLRCLHGMILIILCRCASIFAADPDYIPSDWVDPTDMRYYDRYSKSMQMPGDATDGSSNVYKKRSDQDEIRKFEAFVERFINRFLHSADLKDKVLRPDTRIVTEIPVLISTDELSRLITLGQRMSSSKLTELDEIFSAVLSAERGYSFDLLTPYLNPIEQLFYHMSWEKIAIMTSMTTFGVVLWMFAVGRSLKRIMIFVYLIFFMGGLAGNWWKMYQEAVAERFAKMKKLSAIPDVCSPTRNSFWNYLFGSVDEECKQYHKAFQVDPFSQVSPSVVLSETISMMLIHPLKALGSGIGDFLKGVNGAAPFPVNLLFLPIIYITSLCALFFFSMAAMGINLNFWTWFGGINIGGKQERSKNYPTISDERDLKDALEFADGNEFALVRVRLIRRCFSITAPPTMATVSENRENEALRTNRLEFIRSNSTSLSSPIQQLPSQSSLALGEVNSFCQLYKVVSRPSKGVIKKKSLIRRRVS